MTTLDTLESIVDKEGLAAVLLDLAEICSQKAQHINDNWQDTVLSKQWEKAGFKINNTAAHIKSLLP